MKVLQNSSEVSIGKFKAQGKDNINFTVSPPQSLGTFNGLALMIDDDIVLYIFICIYF